jgi:hypothetical protein
MQVNNISEKTIRNFIENANEVTIKHVCAIFTKNLRINIPAIDIDGLTKLLHKYQAHYYPEALRIDLITTDASLKTMKEKYDMWKRRVEAQITSMSSDDVSNLKTTILTHLKQKTYPKTLEIELMTESDITNDQIINYYMSYDTQYNMYTKIFLSHQKNIADNTPSEVGLMMNKSSICTFVENEANKYLSTIIQDILKGGEVPADLPSEINVLIDRVRSKTIDKIKHLAECSSQQTQ